MPSIWIEEQREDDLIRSDPFESGKHYDAVVVGAGLTGLTSAFLLARAGLSVAVLEARSVGAVTTGNSNAKVSLLHSGAISAIHSHVSNVVLRAYVEANREGQEWLLRYLNERGVEVQTRDAFSYAVTSDGARSVDKEFEACLAAGLEVSYENDVGLPFGTYAGVMLKDQAQVNPMDVLHALARDVRAHGGLIMQGTRVTGVDIGEPSVVSSSRGHLFATRIVLATGVPILDRGLYFAKVKASRSYVMAFRVPDAQATVPRGMYLSLDSPSRSLRTASIHGEERLLVGGNGHTVGREQATLDKVEDLDAWVKRHFPGAKRTHSWSAQDYESVDRIPFVGWMPRTNRKVLVATGFNKWGMTNAVAAALSIASEVLGGQKPWAHIMQQHPLGLETVASAVALNAEVAGLLTGGWVKAELHPLPHNPPGEGSGIVGNDHLRPTVTSTVDGEVCRFSAVCPHLGGILSWNDAERSWDCPLHGSRFDARGRLLEGPATEDLKKLD